MGHTDPMSFDSIQLGFDYKILLENCSKKSKALRLAKRARTKYNKGRRRVKQVRIGGRKKKTRRNQKQT